MTPAIAPPLSFQEFLETYPEYKLQQFRGSDTSCAQASQRLSSTTFPQLELTAESVFNAAGT
ncbi:MAG: hypothetical protein WBA57_16895 [Elainellaceae cyanobacterium]